MAGKVRRYKMRHLVLCCIHGKVKLPKENAIYITVI